MQGFDNSTGASGRHNRDDPAPGDQTAFDAWIEGGEVLNAEELAPVLQEHAEALKLRGQSPDVIRRKLHRAVCLLANSLASTRGASKSDRFDEEIDRVIEEAVES